MALAAKLPRQEVIVPRKTVLELSKLLADSDDEVRIELSATQAAFASAASNSSPSWSTASFRTTRA